MEKKVPGAKSRAIYDDIAEELAGKGVVSSQMFGMPSLKAGGKAFAGLYGDSMVFKLPPKPHAEALKLRGAELFDPSEMGRPMKEWVVLSLAHAKRWLGFAEHARGYVAG